MGHPHPLKYVTRHCDPVTLAWALVIPALPALVWLFSGCQPVKSPTAEQLTIAALNTTDAALEAAVAVTNTDEGLDRLDHIIKTWEQAADLVREGKDLCPALTTVGAIGAEIGCSDCVKILTAAKEQVGCNQY